MTSIVNRLGGPDIAGTVESPALAPEAAAGGPLQSVRDGDQIVLDVDARRLDIDVPAPELARRQATISPAR